MTWHGGSDEIARDVRIGAIAAAAVKIRPAAPSERRAGMADCER
jgi:hypothetical protein